QRGYTLTANESELQQYRQRLSDASASLVRLTQLTTDNPNQQRNAGLVKELVDAKVARMEAALRIRKELGLQAAADATRNGTNQELMAEFRDRVNAMRAEEQR